MNPQKEDILSYLYIKKSDFQRSFNVIKLGLFGSYALNQQTEESDIDLLIEFAPNTDALAEKKEAIRQAVQSAFGKNVDLCREKYIKPYLKNQILKSVIYV
ncbi:MAG: nucleotidyltransferase domain-containing protein [Tunicatimonas sp.]